MKTQSASTGTVLFYVTSALVGVGGHSNAPAALPRERDPVSTLQEAWWVPGPDWIVAVSPSQVAKETALSRPALFLYLIYYYYYYYYYYFMHNFIARSPDSSGYGLDDPGILVRFSAGKPYFSFSKRPDRP